MNEGVKPLHILIVVVLAAAAFGGGVFLLQKPPPPPRQQEAAAAQLAALSLKDEPEDKPAQEAAPAAEEPPAQAAPAPAKAAPAAEKSFSVPAPPLYKGWAKTIWGLPNPRKLTAKEKNALALLGTVEDTGSFKFSSVYIEDGSKIPGVPAPEGEEVTRRVVAKVKALGLPDGFEAVIRELSVFNLNHLVAPVTKHADWATLAALLGPADADTSQGDVYMKQAGRRTYYRVTWHRYGWLEFGVADGKVRALRADLRHAEVIPAESVAGGRSPPDPVKAAEMKKNAPRRGDPEAALKLLGQAADVRVTERKAAKPDPNFPALVRTAQELVGKDLVPHMAETARKLKPLRQAEHLVVTPTRTASLEQILEVMGPGNVKTTDTTTVPGKTVTWYRFHAIDFGEVDGQIRKVRMLVLFAPAAKKEAKP